MSEWNLVRNVSNHIFWKYYMGVVWLEYNGVNRDSFFKNVYASIFLFEL